MRNRDATDGASAAVCSSRTLPLSAASHALRSLFLLWCVCALAPLAPILVCAQLAATWIQLDAMPADASVGSPCPRSDHSLVSLAGLSMRPNAAVSFPTTDGMPPAIDPFDQSLWLYAGRGADGTGLADAWMLNLSATVPTWSKMQYSNVTTSPAATRGRWGVPIAWIPNGLDPADSGLTAVTFGGVSENPADFDRVSTFNVRSGVWRDWLIRAAAAAATDDVFPFARGLTSLVPLPLGYGSGSALAVDAPDSGSFLLLGGFGSADGVHNSALHQDWPDAWALNISARSWTRLDHLQCDRNITTCTDVTTLQSLLGNYTAVQSGHLVNFTQPDRPSALAAAVAELRAAFDAFNSSIAALADAAGACTTYCAHHAPPQNTPALSPPPLEGSAFVSILVNSVWTGVLFGGYGCAENGAHIRGGDACYLSDLWLLDYASMTWSVKARPWSNQTDTDVAAWPSLRAYHTMVAHQQRGLIIVTGGSYQSSDGRTTYYSDVFAFDVAQLLWVPVQIQGVVPTGVRGAAAALRGDTMFWHGGAAATGVVSQFFALRIGLGLTASNGYASGAGLVSSLAGSISTFTVQMREFTSTWNSSTSQSDIVWGAPATYGTGLASQLSGHLFTFVKGALVLVSATTAATSTPGLYEFSYVALFGRSYEVHIDLGGYALPGSPFAMELHPYPLINPAACSATAVSIVEKGGVATVQLQIVDVYSNPFWDGSWLQPFADPSAPQRSDDGSGTMRWNNTNPFDNNGVFTFGIDFDTGEQAGSTGTGAGTPPPAAPVSPLSFSAMFPTQGVISIRYTAPSLPSYRLHVRVSGVDVLGSPFTVVGLDPIALPSSLSHGLLGSAICVALLCVLSSAAVHVYRSSAVMRSSSPNFLHLLHLGSALSALSVVPLTVEGSDAACQAFPVMLSAGVVLGFGALLAKSARVMRIFNAKQLRVKSHLSDAWLALPLLALTALMLLINVIWISVDPQHSAALPSSTYPSVLSFKSCVGRNGTKWVASLLAFFAVGLAYGGYVAVSTGHVPSRFNEAKLVSASVYNLFTLSLVTVPLLFFLSGSSDFLVARTVVLASVILWCSVFPVLVLIVPKLLVLSGIMKPPTDAMQTTGTSAAKGSSTVQGTAAAGLSAGPRRSVQTQGGATTTAVSQRPSVKAGSSTGLPSPPSKLPLPPLPRASLAATRLSRSEPASSGGVSASPITGSRSPNSTVGPARRVPPATATAAATPPALAAPAASTPTASSPSPLLLPASSSPPITAGESAAPVAVESVELMPFAPRDSQPQPPQPRADPPSASDSPSASPSSSVSAAVPGASPLSASPLSPLASSPSSRPPLRWAVASGSSAAAPSSSPLSPPSLRLPSPHTSAARAKRIAGLLADAEGAGIGTTQDEATNA